VRRDFPLLVDCTGLPSLMLGHPTNRIYRLSYARLSCFLITIHVPNSCLLPQRVRMVNIFLSTHISPLTPKKIYIHLSPLPISITSHPTTSCSHHTELHLTLYISSPTVLTDIRRTMTLQLPGLSYQDSYVDPTLPFSLPSCLLTADGCAVHDSYKCFIIMETDFDLILLLVM